MIHDDIILGIDLGTTFSCMAYMDDAGKPRIIPNAEGNRTTPSVVWFDEENNRVVVGEEARDMALIAPESVASQIKRQMGDEDYRFSCFRGDLRAEQVSAYILRKMVQDASATLGHPIHNVVITCPAYFFIRETEATKAAGELAGLNVLAVLKEPTAAAIAYGFSGKGLQGSRNVLVYDLGGGTFDVSIITCSSEGINVVCTDGNHQLGGIDWDLRMESLIISKISENSGVNIDIDAGLETHQELIKLAERAKIQLSQREETSLTLSYAGEKHRVCITRGEFEEASRDLLQETCDLTLATIQRAATLGADHIDEFIMVGGSSRMPQVSNMLSRELHCTPKCFEPDEAVAKGAAIVGKGQLLRREVEAQLGTPLATSAPDHGFRLEARRAMENVAQLNGITLEALQTSITPISNVCSKSFGQALLNIQHELAIYNIIYRNTNLPAQGELMGYTIKKNQRSVKIRIYENLVDEPSSEEKKTHMELNGIPLEEGTLLWEGELQLRENLNADSPIETTLRLDADGLLHAESRDPESGNHISSEIHTNGAMSDEEKQRIQSEVISDTIY